MNIIWRFYTDPNLRWRWQRLATDRTVISESHAGYAEYDASVADATDKGYVILASQVRPAREGRDEVKPEKSRSSRRTAAT
jgi:hypothetical protein